MLSYQDPLIMICLRKIFIKKAGQENNMLFPKKRYLRIREAFVFSDLGRRFLRMEVLGKSYWFFIKIHTPITRSEYIDIDFENAKSLNLLPHNFEEMTEEHKKEALEYLRGKRLTVIGNIKRFDVKKHSKAYKDEIKKKEEEKKQKKASEKKTS